MIIPCGNSFNQVRTSTLPVRVRWLLRWKLVTAFMVTAPKYPSSGISRRRWICATDGLTAPSSRSTLSPGSLRSWRAVSEPPLLPGSAALAPSVGATGVAAIAALSATDACLRREMVLRASSASSRRRRERSSESSQSSRDPRSRIVVDKRLSFRSRLRGELTGSRWRCATSRYGGDSPLGQDGPATWFPRSATPEGGGLGGYVGRTK